MNEQETIERTRLGDILMGKPVETLAGWDFVNPANAVIFDAMVGLSNDRAPIDTMTVRERLRDAGKLEAVGGDVYLLALTDPWVERMSPEEKARFAENCASLARRLQAAAKTTVVHVTPGAESEPSPSDEPLLVDWERP